MPAQADDDSLNLTDRPLLEFLSGLGSELLERLYESPAAAFVIFRMLPSLCQQCILKLLWLQKGDERCTWQTWGTKEGVSTLKRHLILLRSMDIVDGEDTLSLNPKFRTSYLKSIRDGAYRSSGLQVVDELDEKSKRSASKDLGKRAVERWECVLYYLALPSQKSEQGVSGTTKSLLKSAGLTSGGNDEGDIDITSTGFQFLLLNRTAQIWTYLLHYFKHEMTTENDIVPVLDFLFRLTLCADSTSSLMKISESESQSSPSARAFVIDESWPENLKAFLTHLRELGLVFIRKRKDGFFFITPLLTFLTFASSSSEEASELRRFSGYIIVETNFRIYAYTDSNLQLAIVSTFTEMLYRFNNMSVGLLSREAVRRALQVGITAQQIISFLRANAHPETIAASNATDGLIQCVPVTVADQIRLWEDERKRITYSDAVLYLSFESEREYHGLKAFTKSEDTLLWFDDVQRLVVVKSEAHEAIKTWWKQNKASVNGRQL